MSSLMTIVNSFQEIDRLLMESGGEITPEIESWLVLNEKNLSEKVDNYKLFIDHLENRIDYFKNIKEQCNSAQSVLKNTIEKMKSNLRFTMEAMSTDELSGSMYRYKLTKPVKKTSVTCESLLPNKYIKERTVIYYDYEMIEKDIASGVEIPGVAVVESRQLRCYIKGK